MNTAHKLWLFKYPSSGWSLLGDNLLWQFLENSFNNVSTINEVYDFFDETNLLHLIEEATNCDLETDKTALIDGSPVDLKHWLEKLLPLLIERCKQFKEEFRLNDSDMSEFDIDDLTITIEKESGFCSEHDSCFATIYGDGDVTSPNNDISSYPPKRNLATEGNIPQEQILHILNKLTLANFLNLRDEYSALEEFEFEDNLIVRKERWCTDLGSYTITLQVADKFKSVYNYLGAPSELSNVESYIEGIVVKALKRYKKKPRICPKCSQNSIVRIMYGYPSSKMMHDAEEGRIILGGCCLPLDFTKWGCTNCGAYFQQDCTSD